MQMVLEECDLAEVARRVQARALHQCVGPSGLQEEVAQGTSDHLSREEGLAAIKICIDTLSQ